MANGLGTFMDNSGAKYIG
jgi:hypothetical protein